jgi:hypothetical protein
MARLWTGMLIVVLVLELGYCVLFGYGSKRFLGTSAIEVGSMGSTRRLSQVIAFQARQLELACTFPRLAAANSSTLQKRLTDAANNFSALIGAAQDDESLFNGDSIPVWTTPLINSTFSTTAGAPSSSVIDPLSLFNLYSSHVTQLATLNASSLNCPRHNNTFLYTRQYSKHEYNFVPSWQFVMTNGISNVIDCIWKVLDITMITHLKRSGNDLNNFFILVGSILFLPLLLIIFFVIPYYKAFSRERRAILLMFYEIPNDLLKDMAESAKSALCKFNKDASPLHLIRGNMYSSSFASFNASSVGTRSFDEFLQDGQVNIPSPAQLLSDIRKSRPAWVKLCLIFSISIVILITFVSSSTYLMYNASQITQEAAIKVNYAGSRRSYTYRLLVLAQEWIRRDEVIWPDLEMLRDMYLKNIQDAFKVHQGVKYGDSLLSLRQSVNTYPPQDILLRSRQCIDKNDTTCMSLDEMYTTFLQKATQLINENMTSLTFDSEVYKTMNAMQSGTLSRYLDMSKQYYIDEVLLLLSKNALMQRIVFSLSFLVTIFVLFSLWRMKKEIKLHIDGSRQLLYMIPYECSSRIQEIQVYLRRGNVLTIAKHHKVDPLSQTIATTPQQSPLIDDKRLRANITNSLGLPEQKHLKTETRFFGFKKRSQSNPTEFKLAHSGSLLQPTQSEMAFSVPEESEVEVQGEIQDSTNNDSSDGSNSNEFILPDLRDN